MQMYNMYKDNRTNGQFDLQVIKMCGKILKS